MEPAKRTQLYNRIATRCSKQGRLTDHTYDLLDQLVDSIDVEPKGAEQS
jgi:hypothetical protein